MNTAIESLVPYAYSFKETLYNTYELSKRATNLKGCFVECGVAGGAQVGAMIVALKESGDIRKIYAYDSYEGIPLGIDEDGTQPAIGAFQHDTKLPLEQRLVSSGITVHSIDNVKSNLKHLDISNVEFIQGWFQHTVHKHTENIALLRLDGDLYESTMVCLEHLYPKVVRGGYVIVDDYALAGCYKAIHDYFDDDAPKMIKVGGHKDNGVVYFQKK